MKTILLIAVILVSCSSDNPIDSLGNPAEIPSLGLPVDNRVTYIYRVSASPVNSKALRIELSLSASSGIIAPAKGVVTNTSDGSTSSSIKIFHNAHVSTEVSGNFTTTRRVGDIVESGEIIGSGTISGTFDLFVYYDGYIFCYYSFLDDASREFINSWITSLPCF